MRWVIGVAMCAVLGGCLGESYTIRQDELERLTTVAPTERGHAVRVVQRIGRADDTPEAPPVAHDTAVVVGERAGVSAHTARARGGQGMSASGSSGRGAAVVIVAVAAGVGLAVTEGARYDGWVELHPMHPVHLLGPGGQHLWVPLADLTPELVAWSDDARITSREGPFMRLGRAPLDRVGFTYSVELGTGALATVGGEAPYGFSSRISLGYFPVQQLGILGTIGLGWGPSEGEPAFNGRFGVELQLFPFHAGRLHPGVYGLAARGRFKQDTADMGTLRRTGGVFGGGALLQIDWTTRLAAQLRGGVAAITGAGQILVAPELLAGIVIY